MKVMKIKKYFAHILQDHNSRKEQTVEEQCRKTAQYAEKLISVGFAKCGYLAELLHDMGKYSDAFAEYLEACYQKKGGKERKCKS